MGTGDAECPDVFVMSFGVDVLLAPTFGAADDYHRVGFAGENRSLVVTHAHAWTGGVAYSPNPKLPFSGNAQAAA